jgi:hypothetical protein
MKRNNANGAIIVVIAALIIGGAIWSVLTLF